ncbi:hypothetical protein [Stenotrophomonas rhizophila]|uniref:hypothetical protein n=1 Tax=Stenotrophomonas rhizophila TaxID=216778 RepID=UPI001E4BDC81|nr:hypothetical protein [Stenotrophomonas rhizophila]MCC7634830.1 hypothetical protein [Stenotrophomonas rhizophila]MCC7664497.1 hypothetical protein [Stenotrophomonas rhizophila]
MNTMTATAPLLALALAAAFDARAECTVPAALNGLTFINAIDPDYSPENPNAGSLVKLRFAAGHYTNQILNKNLTVEGSYVYRRLAAGVGQLEAHEDFGGSVTRYRLTLVCSTPWSGVLIYNQEQGAMPPAVRQNVGRYTIAEGQ